MGEYAERDNEDVPKWSYLGEDGEEHGFFTDDQMQKWYDSGYFTEGLQIRAADDGKWYLLREYIQLCNGSPFYGNVSSLPMRPYTNSNEYYDMQRQQQITPIPMTMPLHHPNLILPPNVSSSAAAAAYAPRSTANGTQQQQQPYFINPNSSIPATYTHLPPMMMMAPPGMEPYDESQMYQHDGYGNEPENPSSSSVSGTPDSARCSHLMEEMHISMLDKCVSTEDAPWFKTVDCSTDNPNFPSAGADTGTQTLPISIRPREVARLLKELTGVNYYVR